MAKILSVTLVLAGVCALVPPLGAQAGLAGRRLQDPERAPARGGAPGQTPGTPSGQAPEVVHEPDYAHPLGITFDHAERWRVEETALGLSLVPPDLVLTQTGPAEFHSVTMIGADPRVESLDAPLAARRLAELVATQMPFMKPRGAARAVAGRAEIRRFDFAGVVPNGPTIECRVYGLLVDGWFLSLTSIGAAELLDQREAALRETATTLKLGAPRTDDVLVGTWYSQAFSSAGTTSDERLNTSTETGVTLERGGAVRSSSTTSVSAPTATGVTDPSRANGRWARLGDQLWVVWREGGAARWTVFVQGQPGRREMLLTGPDKKSKVLWTEYR